MPFHVLNDRLTVRISSAYSLICESVSPHTADCRAAIMQRDLVAELENRMASSAAPEQPSCAATVEPVVIMQPSSKKAPRALENVDPWELRKQADAAQFTDMEPVIEITITDSFQDAVVINGNMDEVKDLESIKGAYFKTDVISNNYPVWKQLVPSAHSELPLLLFRIGSGKSKDPDQTAGWFLANHLFVSEKDQNKVAGHVDKLVVYLWGSASAMHPWPETMHWPYWARNACPDIVVETIWTAYNNLQLRYIALENDLLKLQEINNMKSAAEGDDANDRRPKTPETEPTEDHYEAAYKGRGKQQQPKKHGGWLPKMAQLIVSIQSSDWVWMHKLIGRFLESSQPLRQVVSKKRMIKKGVDKGCGKSKSASSSSWEACAWDDGDDDDWNVDADDSRA